MATKNHKTYATPHIFWGVLISFLLANVLIVVINPADDSWQQSYTKSFVHFLIPIASGMLLYSFLFIVLNYTIKKIDKIEVINRKVSYYFFITTFVVLLTMILLLFIEAILYAILFEDYFAEIDSLTFNLRVYIVINLIVASLFNSYYCINYYFEKYVAQEKDAQALLIETHQLREIALQTELEALKFQLDPHFLFNSFSTLTHLIATDQEKAQLYLENLSIVYRTILSNSKKNIVTLEAEIALIRAYYELIKIRHQQSIDLQISIAPTCYTLGIAPMTLQLLIENAIKHNKYNAEKPLRIDIFNQDTDYIVVRNSLQRINLGYESTGVGISNIKNRYRILSDELPSFSATSDYYLVKIPLLSITQ